MKEILPADLMDAIENGRRGLLAKAVSKILAQFSEKGIRAETLWLAFEPPFTESKLLFSIAPEHYQTESFMPIYDTAFELEEEIFETMHSSITIGFVPARKELDESKIKADGFHGKVHLLAPIPS